MPILKDKESKAKEIAPGTFRKIVHLDNILTAVIDITDGPMEKPDPPHSHPHEQISYIAEGELIVYIDKEEHQLQKGDMFLIPSNVPHSIKTLTKHVRLVDSFTPVREDFLK